MPFVKLDCGFLDSTLWVDRDAREVFVTALLMAVPREFTTKVEQIEVDSNKPTGWSAPPGWYGFVGAAGTGIVRRSLVDAKAGIEALRRLGEPDPESRTPDFDGRRMIRVDGGYVVLNFIRHRDRDPTAYLRSARWRMRQKQQRDATMIRRISDGDTSRNGSAQHKSEAEAEAEAEAEVHKERGSGGNDTLKLEVQPIPKPKPTNDEWLDTLSRSSAFKHLNVKDEFQKMLVWCEVNHKHPTRRRFVNWLNRKEVPINENRPPGSQDRVDRSRGTSNEGRADAYNVRVPLNPPPRPLQP